MRTEKSLENNILYSDLAKQLCEKLEIDLSVLKEHVPEEDWDPDCFLMDKREFFIKCVCIDPVKKKFSEKQCIYRKNIYLIDYFPKVISLDNKFPQLELFYMKDDDYGLNDLFFEEGKKYFGCCPDYGRTLTFIWRAAYPIIP